MIIEYKKLLMFLLCIFSAHAGHNQEQFLQANKLYHERNFAQALSQYRALPADAAVWENMGNCAYYLEQYPQALLYWSRARWAADYKRYFALTHKIEQASCALALQDARQWQEKYCSAIVALMRTAPLEFWHLLALLGWFLLLIGVPYFFYRRYRFCAIVSFLCAIFACSLYGIYYAHQRKSFGIVMVQSSMRTGMHEQLPVIGELKPGQKVKVVDAAAEWYHVSTAQRAGWVQKKNIEVVEVQC
jgi:hypothetical protein